MGRKTDNTLPSLIEQAFVVRCRICKRQVSRSLYPLSGDQQVTGESDKPLLPRQRFVLTHRAVELSDRLSLGHGVLVDTEDVFDTSCDPGSAGCCGYAPDSGPNLRCAKGHTVGTYASDCHAPTSPTSRSTSASSTRCRRRTGHRWNRTRRCAAEFALFEREIL